MSSGMTCDECVARGLGHRKHDRLWRSGEGWTCAEHTILAGKSPAFQAALRKLSDEAIRRGHLLAASIERTTFQITIEI